MRRAPDNIPRRLIIRAKEPLSSAAQTIVESWPETVIQNYDPVEHGRFLNVRNQAPNVVLHVRDRNIIEILTEHLPTATAAPAVPTANPPVSTTTLTVSSAAASNTGMTSKPDTSVTRNSSAQSATNGATATEKKTPVKSTTGNKTTKKGDKS